MTTPIFIISLPRSGSTLLQKILATNEQVATTAESWIMLPFWGMREPSQGRAIYSHHTAANAINDFIDSIPDGEEVFLHAVTAYARKMYTSASVGRRYFIDKTPRYYLMIPMLSKFFPEAKLILLLRNPLAVLASICKTFNKGRFMWSDYWIDWIEGHAAMAAAVKTPKANQYVVRYEDLVSHPVKTINGLCNWLGIPYNDRMVNEYHSKPLHGRMGDPTGIHQYQKVDSCAIHNWKIFFNTHFRRQIAHKMLNKIGNRTLTDLGYIRSNIDVMIANSKLEKGFDLHGRKDFLIGLLANALDYRYWQARYRAARSRAKYSYGYFRNLF